jgi:hypothetical protein
MFNDNTDSQISEFDWLVGVLQDLPDVVKSKPSTIRATLPLVGIHRSYIVSFRVDVRNT